MLCATSCTSSLSNLHEHMAAANLTAAMFLFQLSINKPLDLAVNRKRHEDRGINRRRMPETATSDCNQHKQPQHAPHSLHPVLAGSLRAAWRLHVPSSRTRGR